MLSCKDKSSNIVGIMCSQTYRMKAWQKQLDAKSKNIRFLGDATGAFTEKMDVGFDATALLGNVRSKRYAIQTKDGKVTSVAIEPDNTGITSELTSTARPHQLLNAVQFPLPTRC